MKKITIATILTFSILFVLSGCGNANRTSSTKSTAKSETFSSSAGEAESFAIPEQCINDTIEFMKGYDYINDVGISVDEANKQINIAVEVPDSVKGDYIRMSGEDCARYLASQVSYVNNDFAVPGSDNIGTLYDTYDLLIKVYSTSGNINEMGAAVSSRKITW